MNCLSCEILNPIKAQVETYALQVFDALAGGCANAFMAFFALWFIFVVLKMFLQGEFAFRDTIRCLIIYAFITVALLNNSLYWEYIYKPLEKTTTNIVSTVVSASRQVGGKAHSLNSMLEEIENVMTKVFDFTSSMAEDASMFDKANVWAVGLFLKIPFVFFWAIFAVYTLEFIMKLMVVSALSPLLLVAAGFDKTRGYFYAGIKVMLQGALTVCIAALVMGLMLTTIKNVVDSITLTGDMVGIWQAFSKLFFLSLVAVLFQLKSPGIASNIIGSSDGPGVAGVMAGGIASGMLFGGHKIAQMSGFVGTKAANLLGKGGLNLSSHS
jgi:type IV secretory pathway VirB6-like protein